MQMIYLDRKRGSTQGQGGRGNTKGEGARGTTGKWMSCCSKPSFPIIFSESSGSDDDGADA